MFHVYYHDYYYYYYYYYHHHHHHHHHQHLYHLTTRYAVYHQLALERSSATSWPLCSVNSLMYLQLCIFAPYLNEYCPIPVLFSPVLLRLRMSHSTKLFVNVNNLRHPITWTLPYFGFTFILKLAVPYWTKPIPVNTRSKAWVCSSSLVGMLGSNPRRGHGLCLL
jgi:hypothetical protein